MAIEDTKAVWPGWETVGMIGRGSFGAVYEIQREIFDDVEKAALKMISIPQNASDIDELYSDGFDDESISSTFKGYLKSIVAEYTMMQKLSGCTNIVNCQDLRYVPHDDGVGWDIFIKMELLTPLTKALPAQVPEETVIQIAKDICAALQLCKKHGIVHRDIKPQNIFVSPNGDFKLGDFGIAKTVEKTTGGTKIGTYKFMAPEVYHSKPYGTASDIYSLGLVLYWLLNERRMPFMPLPPQKLTAGINEASRNRRLSGEPFPEPQNGSKWLKAIVMKACAYNTEDRYASAEEMLFDLNQMGQAPILSGEPDHQDPESPETAASPEPPEEKRDAPVPEGKGDRKKQWMLLGAAAMILVIVLALLLPGKGKKPAGGLPAVQDQTGEPAQIQEPSTETAEKVSQKIKLIEDSWETGSITVTALDDKTLWVQVVDDRPDQQYENLGSPWEIHLSFGEEMELEDPAGGFVTANPYRIGLKSPATKAMLTYEYEQGNTPESFSREFLKEILFMKTESGETGFVYDERYADYPDIERKENTTTFVITLPDWFAVSADKDFVFVDVYLYSSDHFTKIYQSGSAEIAGVYRFYPYGAEETTDQTGDPSDTSATVSKNESSGSDETVDLSDFTMPIPSYGTGAVPLPEIPTFAPLNPDDFMPDDEPAESIPPVPEHNPQVPPVDYDDFMPDDDPAYDIPDPDA